MTGRREAVAVAGSAEQVATIDGVLTRHQSPVVVYKSWLVECASGLALKDGCERAHAARGLAR